MADVAALILLVALLADWRFGEPDILWSRLPHPIVLFGKAVALADRHLNHDTDSDGVRYRKGTLAISLLVISAIAVGFLLKAVIHSLGWIGLGLEAFVVFVLLAQKSLFDHVAAVADGLRDGLDKGREAVSMIVGRDPSYLDETGVSRAAIESLAENFSDGVVAPSFWYLIFGLPGLIAYKMINTADSMIAYRNERYLWFGRAAAQLDDLANWLPARLSAGLIALGIWTCSNVVVARRSLLTAFREAGLHQSPNAGWPEGAMAGGGGFALGGPRTYSHAVVQQPWINGAGKRGLGPTDIMTALNIFARSCMVLWGLVALLLLV